VVWIVCLASLPAIVEVGAERFHYVIQPGGRALRYGPVARVRRESHVADARRSLQEPRGPSFSRTLNLPVRLPLAR
jgi:hypothetical protein